jgi:ribose transport system substrate-binding protein
MKKVLVIMLAAIMVLSLIACGSKKETTTKPTTEEPTTTAKEPAKEASGSMTVYALTPDEDHGWTGSVAAYGKRGVDEINAAGKYKAVLQTAGGAEEQIQQIEDIIANNKVGEYAVVMLPYDSTVEAAVTQLVDAGVPVVMFDRIIMSAADKAVANVKGDNIGTGAAAAYYCVEKGLAPGKRAWVLEGDSSSVNVDRNDGFVNFLLGTQDYNGKYIETAWTKEEVNANIVYSGVTGWNQATAQQMFETLMSDPGNADIKYIASWDSGTLMGVFDALSGSAIDENTKKTFLSNKPVMCGCSGLIYLYDLIAGASKYPEYVATADHCEGLMYTTYEPQMFYEAVQVIIQHLDGKTVEQDYVIATDIVEAGNCDKYEPFE